jgi:hypothetical protein
VPYGIEIDPECVAGLEVGLRGAERKHVLLATVEIVDVEIQMQLLGSGAVRPRRRHERVNFLKAERWLSVVHQLNPRDVLWQKISEGLDFQSSESGVKVREGQGIWTVKRGDVKLRQGHWPKVVQTPTGIK